MKKNAQTCWTPSAQTFMSREDNMLNKLQYGKYV